jgi:hypothetical protein
VKVTNQDAKKFGLEMREHLYAQGHPWPTMDECIVIGFRECRQRLLDELKERFKAAENYADDLAEPQGIVGAAFQEAIKELERISQP